MFSYVLVALRNFFKNGRNLQYCMCIVQSNAVIRLVALSFGPVAEWGSVEPLSIPVQVALHLVLGIETASFHQAFGQADQTALESVQRYSYNKV